MREANVLGDHLGTPVALPWMHCLCHVPSQISPACFAQQQDVFVIKCRQYSANILLDQLSTCWCSCRVISMKQVSSSMASSQRKAYRYNNDIQLLPVVGAALSTIITVSMNCLFFVRACLWHMDPTCFTVTIQTLAFYHCLA